MRPALDAKQAKVKNAYLMRTYHITLDFFNRLREFQDYKCGICRRHEIMFRTGMAVDHNHKTGEVRGLLCWSCNRLLGRFFDDNQLLVNMAYYVQHLPVVTLHGASIYTAPHRVGSAVRAKALAQMNGLPTPKRRVKRGKQRRKRATKG
jgi:hypothetical protein